MVNKLVAAAETDTAAENEGAWFELALAGNVFRVKLARAGVTKGAFQRDMEKRLRPFRNGTRDNAAVIPDDVVRKINAELYATHIVKDWNADDFGEACTPDNVRNALLSSTEFLEWCIATAASAENFRKLAVDANAGN